MTRAKERPADKPASPPFRAAVRASPLDLAIFPPSRRIVKLSVVRFLRVSIAVTVILLSPTFRRISAEKLPFSSRTAFSSFTVTDATPLSSVARPVTVSPSSFATILIPLFTSGEVIVITGGRLSLVSCTTVGFCSYRSAVCLLSNACFSSNFQSFAMSSPAKVSLRDSAIAGPLTCPWRGRDSLRLSLMDRAS